MDVWTDRLSEYIDEELGADERVALERHVETCAECAKTLADLRQVVSRAQMLPPRPPSADLWPGIERRLSSWRIERFGMLGKARLSFSLPQLAAAAVLVAAASGAVTLKIASAVERHPAALSGPQAESAAAPRQSSVPDTADPQVGTVSLADAQYDAAVADLERALKLGRGRLDASTIAAIEQSLQAIDQAIEQARQALASDPANSYLTGHLVETRRRKLELLRRAAALADTN